MLVNVEEMKMRNYFKLEQLLSKASEILRQIFRERYRMKTGNDWNDSAQLGSTFVSGIGATVYSSCKKKQQVILCNGNCNDWDLTLLSSILLKSKFPNKLSNHEEDVISKENKNIKKLRELRNDHKHHPNQNINDQMFEKLWKKIGDILISISNIDANYLDDLKKLPLESISEIKVNSANLPKAVELKLLGNNAYWAKNYSEAIDIYSQIIELPGLPERDLAVLYSNRSTAFLQKHFLPQNDVDNTYLYRALNDAKKVKELWPTWWKTYYKIGKAYDSLNKLEKAIIAFDTALALDPTNEEITNARSACRYKKGRQDRQENLDSRYLDMNEHWNKFYSEEGFDLDSPLFKILKALGNEALKKIYPVLSDVWMGHKYRFGDCDVQRDCELAAQYYGKAVKKGNAEAMFNLAILYTKGHGVKQDFKKAIYLLEQAADQPASSHLPSCNGFTVGVAEAEHSLGLCYAEGVGVEKSYFMAVSWYRKAIEHGSPYAANNLGLMYMNGIFVDRDFKQAEQLFELAISRKNPDAMINLADLYMEQCNPELALIWHHRAIEDGNLMAKIRAKEFESTARMLSNSFESTDIPNWERDNNITVDGLNHQERFFRMCAAKSPQLADYLKAKLTELNSLTAPSTPSIEGYTFDINMLKDYANMGSITAEKMVRALEHFYHATDCLKHIDTNGDTASMIRNGCIFLDHLAASFVIEHFVVSMTPEMLKKSCKIIDIVLKQCSSTGGELENDPTLLKANESAHVCRAALQSDDLESNIKFLNMCTEKYPNNTYFYELRPSLFAYLGNFKETLANVNIGLTVFPNNYDLLYKKAAALRLQPDEINDPKKTITAYEEFISKAPKDHRKVPESYYSIANCYGQQMDVNMLKLFYEKGLEAESVQLPCFLPYVSNTKVIAACLIENRT